MLETLLIVAALSQQQADPPAPLFAQQIVVTAERGEEVATEVPAATSVLTKADVEAMAVRDLADIVDHLPGVTMLLEGAGSRPMLTARGFFGGGEVEYVQLLVDGVPAGDVESGLADWGAIPAASVERVEFLRGPASSLYGDAALAGVIEVFTTAAEGAAATHVRAGTGSFDSTEASVSWRGGGAPDARVTASWFSTNGYRDHAAAERASVELSGGAEAGGGRVTFRIAGSAVNREEPGMLPVELIEASPRASLDLFRFDDEESRRLRASVDYVKTSGVPLRIVAWATARDTSLVRTVLLAAGVGDRVARELESRGAGFSVVADYGWSLAGRPSLLRGGVDASRDSADSSYFAVGDDGARGEQTAKGVGSRNRHALFATNHLELTQRARLTLGVRYDSIRDDFAVETAHHAWSPRVGLNYRFGDDRAPWVVFAQAARAFKAPSIDQRFDVRPYPDFRGGSFTVSNPDLQPQTATNLEVGMSRTARRMRWDVAGYRMKVDDEIDFDVATFSYRNIGESLHRGVEVSGEWRGGRVSPRLSYAWTSVESVGGGYAGRQLKNIPEHVVQPAVRVWLPLQLQLDASLRLLSGWFLDDANTVAMDDASQLDLRLRRMFGPWGLHVDVVNALDEVVPHVGVVLPSMTGGGVAYGWPSTGRSVSIGVDRSF
jgi:outer membrane cobalamin receptor